MEDIEYIVTTPGEADTAPEGARKINANFDRLVAALPTKVSDLTNDLAYLSLTGALQYFYLKNQTYTREEINQKIAAIKTASFEVVDALPASGEENIIYLVPKDGEEPDTHDEYIWMDGAWELIGSTQIDLSNYLQKTGDASDTTVTFVPEAGDPTSGSKLSSLIGRIVKKLSDMVSGAIAVAKATKATQDADGNKISDTYLKRSGGTMTGNLALSNEVRVNGAVGNLIGRFTWAGGLKAVVGNSQDTLALLSKDAATLNGSPIFTRAGGLVSDTLVQKKGNCSIHTDVASYRMPDNHTGWVRIDFGLLGAELLGVIDMIVYGKGGISIDFSGYTYVSSSNPTANNWYGPKYGIRGSVDAPMPQVRFAKDNTTGRRYIMIGGDSFKWGPYGFISLSKIVLGSLGNTTGNLGVSIEAVSGNYADLGLTNASVSNPSVSIEVERARKATLAETLGEDAYTSSQVVGSKGALSTAEDEFPKDLSSIKTPGIYAITSRNTGQPSGHNYGVLCVFTAMKEGNNRTVQMFTSSKSREGGLVSRSFVRYQFDNLLNWAFTPWVELVDTYDLPSVYVDTVPSNPKDGDILITTTD